MDSPPTQFERWKSTAANRRTKAIALAILVVVAIVALQADNLKQRSPMCELFANCNLKNIDLHRMQIALSQSGLSEFEVVENTIRVPQNKQAEYLQAIAGQNAIPSEITGDETLTAIANPFLSRSQQRALERESRKRQIKEMVVRLPFVESAWFEMDDSEPRRAFQPASAIAKKSAVVSVRPIKNQPLQDPQVDTIRQMIKGTVTGLTADQIVVIDLSTGLSHCSPHLKRPDERKRDARLAAKSAALARQQLLEEQLRHSLTPFPGVVATVTLSSTVPTDNQTEAPNQSERPNVAVIHSPSPELTRPVAVPTRVPTLAGANRQASIYDSPIPSTSSPSNTPPLAGPPHLVPVGFPAPVGSVTNPQHRVSVRIDVPYELLATRTGNTERPLPHTTRSTGYQSSRESEKSRLAEHHFSELKTEIGHVVRPLISNQFPNATPDTTPIAFHLMKATDRPIAQWQQMAQTFLVANWPSLAVLATGLVLIAAVTRQKRFVSTSPDTPSRNVESDHVDFSTNLEPKSSTESSEPFVAQPPDHTPQERGSTDAPPPPPPPPKYDCPS